MKQATALLYPYRQYSPLKSMQDQKTKNILVFHHEVSLYGASQSLLTVLEHLVKSKDLKILLLLPKTGALEGRLKAIGVNYKVIPFPRCITGGHISLRSKIKRVISYLRDEAKMLTVLIDLSKAFKPNLIYSNSSGVSIGFKLSRFLHIPHVWHIREFGDIDYNLRYLPFRAVVKNKLLKSEKVIFASNALLSHWARSPEERFSVVHNGVFSESQKTRPLKKPDGHSWKFGIIGTVVPAKGQDVAILAFSKLVDHYPDCELHIYGGTGNRKFMKMLESEVSRMGDHKRVFFHDFVVDNRLIYNALDVVLSCARNEAFGRTVVEAMSRGIPVIANASGGPVEIIEDGQTGLLYSATPEDLFEKMQLLMRHDQLYDFISEKAVETAKINFSIAQYVGSVKKILIQAIGKN